jgi:AcrR family transcriptional regulator
MVAWEAANPPQQTLRDRKKADVRSTILVSAEKLFRGRGYSATSMADIADAAKVSRKTLFNYVASKESIILALIDGVIGAHMPGWLESDIPVHHDSRDIHTANWKARLDEIAQHRWLLTLAAEHTSFFMGGSTRYASDTYQINREARVRRIAAVQAEGKIRCDISPEEISGYYDALRDLTIRNWLLTPGSSRKELHRMFENAMELLERGLTRLTAPGIAARDSPGTRQRLP